MTEKRKLGNALIKAKRYKAQKALVGGPDKAVIDQIKTEVKKSSDITRVISNPPEWPDN